MAHRGHAADLGITIAELSGGTVPLAQLPGSAGQLDNLAAVAPPTATDDSNAGYSIGSRWIDTASDAVYECADATPAAAVWKNLTAAGGQTLFDAIVPDDYSLPSAAFSAGAKSVFVKTGTYAETTNDIVIPNGGRLVGEELGVIITFTTGRLLLDGNSGTKETTGTISFTNGSVAVVGTGTTFTNLAAGEFIALGADFYEIDTITDATNLNLVKAWNGRTRSGFPMFGQMMFSQIELANICVRSSTSTDAGVFIRAIRDSHLQNVLVEDCTHNVKVTDCGNLLLDNVKSFNSTNDGFNVTSSRTVRFDVCHAMNAGGDGFHFNTNSLAIKATGCEADNNGIDGYTIEGSCTDIDIVGCGSKNNFGKGTNSEPGTIRCVITGCTIAFNGGDGCDYDGTENVITANVITNNGGVGVQAGDNGVICGNQIESNTGNGITADNDDRCSITGNRVALNGGDGVNLNGTNTENIVAGNIIYNNTGTGLLIGASSSNTRVGPNTITSNGTNYTNNSSSTIEVLTTATSKKQILELTRPQLATKSATFETVIRFRYRGSTGLGGAMNAVWVVGGVDSGATASIRLRDITNAQTIAANTSVTTVAPALINLGTVSNVPASPAIFELQILKSAGGGADSVYASSCSIEHP